MEKMMKKKHPFKICYFLKKYPVLSQTFIVNEMKELQNQGVDITIFARAVSGEKIVHEKTQGLDIPIYYLPPISSIPKDSRKVTYFKNLSSNPSLLGSDRLRGQLSINDFKTVAQVAMIAPFIKNLGIDHIHAHFATTASTAASVVSDMTGIPYTFTAHARDIYHESVDKKTLAEKISKAKFVITVSDFNKQYLEKLIHAEGKTGRIIRLYNGIDLKQSKIANKNTAKKPKLIIAVGRLVAKKGFDSLVKACKILNENGQDFKCEIIGEGQERVILEQLINRYSLSKRVFLLGAKSQSDVIQSIRAAAVFVLPCIIDEDGDRDGLPTVILEAMALGTPVISTQVTGIPEMITDGVSGLLVAEKDPLRLADAITRLLDSELLQKQLSDAAQTRVQQDFNLVTNVRILREYFTQGRKIGDSE